jgi:hypothetical protein
LRIAAVVKVVATVVVDVKVIVGIPVVGPVFRPRIKEQERKPIVVETRIPLIDYRTGVEAEEVLAAEVDIEAGLWHVVTAVASALRPGAMIGGPVLGAILLPGVMLLPASSLL